MDVLTELNKIVRFKMKLKGFKSKMVDTHVSRQHVYDIPGKGKLPTLVVLHGIGANSTSFEKVLNIFQRFFKRIVVPEAPGHGFSENPLMIDADIVYDGLVAVINKVVKEDFIIFGNSMGGGLAIKYAIDFPERVKALSLSSPAGAYMQPEDWTKFLDRFRVKNHLDAIKFMNNITAEPNLLTSVLLAEHILVNGVGSRHIQDLVDTVPHDYLFTPEQLEELKMPIQFIWGKKDRIMIKEQLDFFKEHLPKHSLIDEPDEFGHCPYLDHPVQLAARVIDFCEKINNDL
jgi:pimeloyl-ACP methyl ester carboxylesterase